MSTPFDIRIPVRRFKPEDNNDLSSLLPGYIVYLKDSYIDLILKNLHQSKRVGRLEEEYKKSLRDFLLKEYSIDSIPTITKELLSTSFVIRKGKSHYYIELDRGSYIIDKRLTVDKYLRILEYGKRGLSPRGVFLRSKRTIEACILSLWYTYYDDIGGDDRDRYRDIRQSGYGLSEGRLRTRSLRSYKYRRKENK